MPVGVLNTTTYDTSDESTLVDVDLIDYKCLAGRDSSCGSVIEILYLEVGKRVDMVSFYY